MSMNMSMSIDATRHGDARRYIRRIRNLAKRAYAEQCYRAACHGDAEFPHSASTLSYMGGQEVRHQLYSILYRQ